MAETLREGASFTITRLVAESDLASSLSPDPEDRFPRVFATARMVAMMELTAARLMRPLLGKGELSVGVSIDVVHEAATPPGVEVKTTARFLGTEGKTFLFEVTAEDPGGRIGAGKHRRAIVTDERLVSGAAKRMGGSR
ncbi:MAG TPA: thioesterase [Thermoanaerobaculia bacterium]|nr:thioesterase [Thermoanaerobaculia bacterium]